MSGDEKNLATQHIDPLRGLRQLMVAVQAQQIAAKFDATHLTNENPGIILMEDERPAMTFR